MEKTENFTKIPNKILHSILLNHFTKRELKIMFLIARLTYGCHRKWARFNLSNLQIVGISPSHAGEVMEILLQNTSVIKNNKTMEFRINEDFLLTEANKKELLISKLKKVVGKNLPHKTSQNGNEELPETGIETLPKEEDEFSQKSNLQLLPKKEVSRSNNGEFSSVKEIMKDKYR